MNLTKFDQTSGTTSERTRPFWDLIKKVDFDKVYSALDVGCGKGDLTQALHLAYQIPRTLGIDSSPEKIDFTKSYSTPGLTFQNTSVENFNPKVCYDLIVSNAALEWVEDHVKLFHRMLSWLTPNGQLAIQLPLNHEHPSHRVAKEVAQDFGIKPRPTSVLQPEEYARILWNSGLHSIDISMKLYLYPKPSLKDVVEWTNGSLFSFYQKRLSATRFDEFTKAYTQALVQDNRDDDSYLYTFKRMFITAKRD